MHLRDRIRKGNVFSSYIPDFVYEIVRVHDYTNADFLEKDDEISVIMMINKIQNAEDLRKFCQSPPETLDRILRNTTPSIRRIIRDTLYSLLMKMNVPVEEANQYAESVEECRMGYLFENMEKMDIQAERRNTAQARAEAEMAKQEAEAAKQKAEVAEQKAEAAKQEVEAAKHKAEQKLISLIKHRLAKNLTAEQIAGDLLEPVEYIRELISQILQADK